MQKKVIRYFKECYQADNSSQSLWNILSKKKQFIRFSTKEERELFSLEGQFSVDAEYGTKLEAAVTTYRREKKLVLCSYFVVGKVASNAYGKKSTRVICSPLYFADVSCDKNEYSYQIKGDSSQLVWNTPVLNYLSGSSENSDAIQNQEPLRVEGVIDKLNNYSENFDYVLEEGGLTSESELNSLIARCREGGPLFILPISIVVLLDRSISSRGIIDELGLMEKSNKSSPPLQSLRQGVAPSNDAQIIVRKKAAKTNINNVPGLLSSAQKDIIEKSSKHDLSVLVGPPGTGKSYTIASLALERFMQGESVLIVSRNEHAVDVIKDKLVEQLGLSQNAVIRAGTKDYHKNLKNYLDQILKGSQEVSLLGPKPGQLSRLVREIRSAERKFSRLLGKVEKDGRLLYAIESGLKKYGLLNRIRLYISKRRVEKTGLLKFKLNEIQKLNKDREKSLSSHINSKLSEKINKTLKEHRSHLVKFRKAIGARTSHKQESIFSEIDFSILLESMPIWLCSLESLHKTLPLESELFDLLVIDEATQCDVASCLPAMYRSKRSLVVGDPKQLRHISFLSRKDQAALLAKCDLESIDISYRDHSMIDVAVQCVESQDSVVMLDEHYRSTPQIINFSNRRFYDSSLRVMTERPAHGSNDSVELSYIEGGTRHDGVNREEAGSLCARLRRLVDEQSVVPDELKLSIGVVSFFRAQADFIQDAIFDGFSLDEITKHKMRAGTPYAFQGEERDIILMSCCVDSSSSNSVYSYMNREDVFNVCITRSREKQIVFLSVTEDEMPSKSLLRDYVSSIGSLDVEYRPDIENRNEVIQEFTQLFTGEGIDSLLNYPIAGVEMDVVLMLEGEVLSIDLVGFPGEEGDAFHIDRYKIFERAGLTIIPVSFNAWRLKKSAVIENIKQTFLDLKEKNTAARLTVADFSSHWTKLLATNPVLANNVRAIEADLLSLRSKKGVSQIGEMIDQYKKVVWVLGEKLSNTELTYTRYMSSSEQVLLSGLENSHQISTILKSLNNSTGEFSTSRKDLREEQESAVDRFFEQNDKAIESLERLALKWSKTKTTNHLSSSSMEGALSDLDDLNERVNNYIQ